jgi:hypothetical protein
MKRLTTVFVAFVLLAVLGGAAFLATWDIPPPSKTVEKEIPDDRLPR